MGACPELLVASSPRASLLEDALLQDTGEASVLHRAHLHPFTVPEEIHHGASARARAPGPRLKLPYQVTPARESGASQAERRLEALTLELERELEMHMKKEYFGKVGPKNPQNKHAELLSTLLKCTLQHLLII